MIDNFLKSTRLKEYINIILGVTLLSAGFYFFMVPFDLVTGGFTGLSIIIETIFNVPIPIFMFIANLAALILGTFFLGKEFFIKTIFGSLYYPIAIAILQAFVPADIIMKNFTDNQLLIASVLSAFVVGTGLALCFKSNASTGGMDVIQLVIHRVGKIPMKIAIFATDGLVVVFGTFLFGIENGFYALLFLILFSQVIDKMLVGGSHSYSVYIISSKTDLLKKQIYTKVDRGVTKIKAIGGYTEDEKELILCVLNKKQYSILVQVVKEIDPTAFMFVNNTSEVYGLGFNEY